MQTNPQTFAANLATVPFKGQLREYHSLPRMKELANAITFSEMVHLKMLEKRTAKGREKIKFTNIGVELFYNRASKSGGMLKNSNLAARIENNILPL